MRDILNKLCNGEDLEKKECFDTFKMIVNGELDPVQISALLVALRTKGETPNEIAGAAEALRESALDFPRPAYPLADSCGTGGDGSCTINISTGAAIVAASMGVKVAKHGNRSISSSCGSADVLEKLGVKIDVSPEVSRKCLDEAGICFLFAPAYHQGLRHAMPVRKTLAIRTVFNVLGPLVNPAFPSFQVMGVYDPALCVPMAQTLGMLGCKTALTVHGCGLDEIAVHGPTKAALYSEGRVEELKLHPAQAGLKTFSLDDIKGSEPDKNAEYLRSLLKGEGKEACESAVALNAGALYWICGLANDFSSGVSLALETIRSGRCAETLQKLVECTNGS